MFYLFLGDPDTIQINLANFKENYPAECVFTKPPEEKLRAFLQRCSGNLLFPGKPLLIAGLSGADRPRNIFLLKNVRGGPLFEEELLDLVEMVSQNTDIALLADVPLPKNHPLLTLAKKTGRLIESLEAPPGIFPFLKALGERKASLAHTKLQELLDEGKEPIFVNLMIAYLLRNLIKAKNKATKGMNPYLTRKLLAQQNNFTEEKLIKLFTLTAETDLGLKSSGEPKLLLSLLVNHFCTQKYV